jgi:hypothetical protein
MYTQLADCSEVYSDPSASPVDRGSPGQRAQRAGPRIHPGFGAAGAQPFPTGFLSRRYVASWRRGHERLGLDADRRRPCRPARVGLRGKRPVLRDGSRAARDSPDRAGRRVDVLHQRQRGRPFTTDDPFAPLFPRTVAGAGRPFHAAGVAAGFRSNGRPGYRDYQPGYYAAYLLDPDGNNVEALYRDVGCAGHGVGDW